MVAAFQVTPPSSEISTPTMPPVSPFHEPPVIDAGTPTARRPPGAGDEMDEAGWSVGSARAAAGGPASGETTSATSAATIVARPRGRRRRVLGREWVGGTLVDTGHPP